jgi:hypothetical protein
LAKLDSPSETPSIKPSHAAATPIVARNAGITVVAISCDQSLNNDASPMPSTVPFSQRVFVALMGLQVLSVSSRFRKTYC